MPLYSIHIYSMALWHSVAGCFKRINVVNIVIILAAILCFLSSIGLGVYAILCGRHESETSHHCLLFMMGSSVSALFVPFFGTIILKAVINIFISINANDILRVKKSIKEDLDLKSFEEVLIKKGVQKTSASKSSLGTDPSVNKNHIKLHKAERFNGMTFVPGLLAFLAFTMFILAYIAFMWTLTLVFTNNSFWLKSLWPYVVTQVLIGAVIPILVFSGLSLFSILLHYITGGQINPKYAISHFLPGLQYVNLEEVQESRSTNSLWVIQGYFYSFIRKPFGRREQLIYYVDCSLSTWLLSVLGSIHSLLAVTYFMDAILIKQITFSINDSSPSEIQASCQGYNCFYQGNFSYIDDCGLNLSNQTPGVVYCFSFLHTIQINDIIASMSIAYIFYTLMGQLFGYSFLILRMILQFISRGKGLFIFLAYSTSAGLITGLIVAMVNPQIKSYVRLSGLQIGQVFLVIVYFILLGTLIFTGRARFEEESLEEEEQ